MVKNKHYFKRNFRSAPLGLLGLVKFSLTLSLEERYSRIP